MAKIIKNTLGNFLVIFLIFVLMAGWLFSGWPRIWQNPRIPPEVKEVEAATEDLHADGAGVDNTFTGVTQANLATNDNDTTKASGNSKNSSFLYATIANTSTCSGTVTSVTAKIYAFSSTSGMTQAIGMYDGTTAVYGSQEQPSTNSAAYSYHEYSRTSNPAGGAWTCADVDNLQVVVDPDKTGAPAGDWRVTELWITVDYTAAPTVSCDADPVSMAFPTLTTSQVYTATGDLGNYASTTMTCDSASGCTLYVSDAGDGANPGLATTTPPYLIGSATETLQAGVEEGYGLQATTTSAGSGGTLTIGATFDKTDDDVGAMATSTSPVEVASSTAAIDNREVLITHLAAITGLTDAANYEDTITYSCTGN